VVQKKFLFCLLFRGFCIEFGAATTVLILTYFKFPISTTHCKVGSVAAVGRARSKNNVDWRLFGSILLTWVITLPATLGLGALVMLILKQFV
jgi:phosphate/sulfate permease